MWGRVCSVAFHGGGSEMDCSAPSDLRSVSEWMLFRPYCGVALGLCSFL